MSDLTFQGVWRMDWGFGNPNKTAAFIAILMVAIWILAYIRRWGFWLAFLGFVGLGIALVHTFSRGGLVSLAAGIIPLLAWMPRPWPKSKVIALLAGFWVIVGASIYLKANERYALGVTVKDSSITNRIQLWKATPAMMADAPDGWGLGNSGNAYMQWYQPLDKNENYRTLVNSHLTWLTEFGWPLRLLYILGWGIAFLLCWPSQKARWRAIALGVWLCFFVSAFFSSVAESPVMWVAPSLFLIAVVIQRLASRQFPTAKQMLVPVSATALIALSILGIGHFSTTTVHGSKNMVAFGKADPKTWVCYDSTTMGNLYGKNIRSSCEPLVPSLSQSVGLLLSVNQIPSLIGKTLVIGSAFPEDGISAIKSAVKSCDKLVLLNPKFFPQEIGIDESNKAKVLAYFGDFSQSPSVEAWRSIVACQQLEGIGDFLPHWPNLIFNYSSEYGSR